MYGDGSVQRPVFRSYNLSHHHQCVHSSHTNPPEAVVGALERELVIMTVGSGRGRTLTRTRRLTKLRDYTAAEKAAATPP